MVIECTFLFTGSWAYDWGGLISVCGERLISEGLIIGCSFLLTERWGPITRGVIRGEESLQAAVYGSPCYLLIVTSKFCRSPYRKQRSSGL